MPILWSRDNSWKEIRNKGILFAKSRKVSSHKYHGLVNYVYCCVKGFQSQDNF